MLLNSIREITRGTLQKTESLFSRDELGLIEQIRRLQNIAPQVFNRIKQVAFEKRRKPEISKEDLPAFNNFLINTIRKLNQKGIFIDLEHDKKIFQILSEVYREEYLDLEQDFEFSDPFDETVEEPEFEIVNGSPYPSVYPDTFEYDMPHEIDKFQNLENVSNGDRIVVIAKGSSGEVIMESGVVSNVVARPLYQKGIVQDKPLTGYRINFEGSRKSIEIFPNTEAMIWYSAISRDEILDIIYNGKLEQ